MLEYTYLMWSHFRSDYEGFIFQESKYSLFSHYEMSIVTDIDIDQLFNFESSNKKHVVYMSFSALFIFEILFAEKFKRLIQSISIVSIRAKCSGLRK